MRLGGQYRPVSMPGIRAHRVGASHSSLPAGQGSRWEIAAAARRTSTLSDSSS